ncbi:hypothetical protein JAAARDRAFT_39397 [Jaapia argillacea MUCL 33604]|uniref:C3H1-type domain-containing protein n=1 Tax=Jaapia argillacea MUCL 33604 TaxID=933084 RepID=A0A067PPW3_9AGAM|nr:hypothetical protein JAAARDRAFT_39397 [Jaapia argillacea MUCL 33604]
MPVVDKRHDDDESRESERDRDRDLDGEREKPSKGGKASSKAKDLSHVPCKFFRVGSCTAGASCPFSHSSSEPGQAKDVCAWFVKGNCKFGHKCALAHILPGQSMSMDRKNKKAAQLASGAGGGGGSHQNREGRGGRANKNGAQGESNGGKPPGGGQGRNALLSGGSTAPTRVLAGSSRPPIPVALKATISPSAPAPALKDTDFAAFGLPDEINKAPAPALQSSDSVTPPTLQEPDPADDKTAHTTHTPLPTSIPSAPRRLSATTPTDLGPIGSPPRASPSNHARVHGFSPGTSPQQGGDFVSTSPFSAPGTQSIFVSYDRSESNDFKYRSGIAASLGATRTWGGDLGGRSAASSHPTNLETAVEDDDLEEFIPGSLSDLLTPEERSRRMSRSKAVRPNIANLVSQADALDPAAAQRANGEGHRHSRSVPAPSLLKDIKSIWGENGEEQPAPGAPPGLSAVGLGNGTPSSFKSNSGFGGRALGDEHPSPSLLSPTNASAAFLPGLHQHYMNAKSGLQRTEPNNLRTGPSSFYAADILRMPTSSANKPSDFVGLTGAAALSPPRYNAFSNRPPFDPNPTDPYSGRRGHATNDHYGVESDDRRPAFSPSARALQAHAPGQSLPQGLAAGYSRIHALPPPPSIPSPSASGAFSPPHVSAFSPGSAGRGFGGSTDWARMSPGSYNDHPQAPPGLSHSPPANAANTFDSMMSRLSLTSAPSAAAPPQAPGMMGRSVSGRAWHQGPLSPLSGPVLTGDVVDDDDLFSMDG